MGKLNWKPFVSLEEYWNYVERTGEAYILAHWEDGDMIAAVEYWQNEWCAETHGTKQLVVVSSKNPDYWAEITRP